MVSYCDILRDDVMCVHIKLNRKDDFDQVTDGRQAHMMMRVWQHVIQHLGSKVKPPNNSLICLEIPEAKNQHQLVQMHFKNSTSMKG